MAVWVERHKNGRRVMFTVPGNPKRHYGGFFSNKRLAEARATWIRGELAAMRFPDIKAIAHPKRADTLEDAALAFKHTRIDVADSTRATYDVNIQRIVSHPIASILLDEIAPADVARWVADLWAGGGGLAPETIRKTRSTLAQILDAADVDPNPARHRSVRLPKEDKDVVMPPIADHVEAALRLLPKQYRLAHLILDTTGMRISEVELLVWRDVAEIEQRFRARKTKTGKPRWVPVSAFPGVGARAVFAATVSLLAPEDRDPDGQVLEGFIGANYRTALTKACTKARVPSFSPHQLRHRRATLWALAGVPRPEAAMWLGHSTQEFDRTYTHADLEDRRELDHAALLVEYGLLPGLPISLHLAPTP